VPPTGLGREFSTTTCHTTDAYFETLDRRITIAGSKQPTRRWVNDGDTPAAVVRSLNVERENDAEKDV
jgi:hypothetical protein